VSLERIEVTPFAMIAGEILQNRRTGYLTIVRPGMRRVLYWSQGELVLAASAAATDSLAPFLAQRTGVPLEAAALLIGDDPRDAVSRLHEAGLLDLSARQALLREWLSAQFVPLFALDEGTSAFTDDEALPPEKRVFIPSTSALVVEGIRSITNGLVLRRSLGDLKRRIQFARDARYAIESLPLNDAERHMASSLADPVTIEAFLKGFGSQSVTAAKVVIMMLTLGMFTIAEERQAAAEVDFADMQRDLELLAAIGSTDQRSLRTVAFSRQLPSLDHYQVLDVPRAATRTQIIAAAELAKTRYEPSSFPPALRETLTTIHRRIDEAAEVLREPNRRGAYDKLLQSRSGGGSASIQQRLTQRSITDQNYAKAKELTAQGDYYGAIVLLKQAVHFVPDHADAWALLASCQERNPKWRRDAAESYQRALSIDPNNVETMISLGDLYKGEGMASRAQTCYEDALKVSPENQQAKSRLQALKKK
jgi:tetratricopeptide (TPR) repeat protein